ncbi:MAG: CocE/NonD family hydrolase [Gemmatimonadaceae bacterium]
MRLSGCVIGCGFALVTCTLIVAPAAGQSMPTQLAADSAWWTPERGAARVRTPTYRGLVRQAVYVTVRDGVRIAADVYLPSSLPPGTRLPAILEQTRYWRSMQPRAELAPDAFVAANAPPARVAAFVTRGYAYVITDVRGTGASFGTRHAELGPAEVRDGYDVVDWIVHQPWSDGKVGSTGVSYVGSTSELLLTVHHPAVKAVAPTFAMYDAYTDIILPGGIANTFFESAWGSVDAALDRNDIAGVFPALAQRFTGVRPVDGDSVAVWLTEAVRDHARNVDVRRELATVQFRDDTMPGGWTMDTPSPHSKLAATRAANVPVYSISGWYDGVYPRSSIVRFRTVRTPGSRLTIGPWNHGGAYVFDPAVGARKSNFAMPLELVRFFDYYLMGIPGIEREPPVHYYTMGEERWKTAMTWPIPEARPARWYLASGAMLTAHRPRNNAGSDGYRVDTTASTGTHSRWNTQVGGGYVDYLDRAGADTALLTYTSVPLTESTEVTGDPVITLTLHADARDATLFAYLEDVDADGHVAPVAEGALRALDRKLARAPYNTPVPYHSFRRADAEPLVPGQLARLVFDLTPTSYRFPAGHRIRIAIAGADRDHFAPPASPPPTIHLMRNGESYVDLPIVRR